MHTTGRNGASNDLLYLHCWWLLLKSFFCIISHNGEIPTGSICACCTLLDYFSTMSIISSTMNSSSKYAHYWRRRSKHSWRYCDSSFSLFSQVIYSRQGCKAESSSYPIVLSMNREMVDVMAYPHQTGRSVNDEFSTGNLWLSTSEQNGASWSYPVASRTLTWLHAQESFPCQSLPPTTALLPLTMTNSTMYLSAVITLLFLTASIQCQTLPASRTYLSNMHIVGNPDRSSLEDPGFRKSWDGIQYSYYSWVLSKGWMRLRKLNLSSF